jgi:signal transduction histidine kinase/CheY-like chemotaxis protein
MLKNLIFILLLLGNLCLAQEDNSTTSKIDSSYFYIENALSNKDNKIFDKALESANKAIVYAQKTKNDKTLANGYFALATIYIDLEKYDQAIEKLIRSVSILNAQNPGSKLALSYYNLGLCYMKKEKYNRAESYFDKSKLIYESIGFTAASTMVDLQKGILYHESNQAKNAENIFTSIIASEDSKSTNHEKAEALYYLGLIKTKENNYHLAHNYLKQAYDYSVESKDISQQIKITNLLSHVYEKLAMNAAALQILKVSSVLKDSLAIISSVRSSNFASNQIKYKEIIRSMDKMDKEKKEQEKASKFTKLINIMSIALITILSLLSLSLYKNNIIRNKSNDLLREKNSELEIAKERIEKASKARSEFLSTVSHELRTPLNAINGISHILLEDNPKKSQIEYLNSLKFSGNYLLTYINEILEINRIESNNIEVENINFNIRELLKNIQNSLKELASANNDDFILNVPEEIPDFLIGDPTKLSQIFINLINNALKFTQNGSVSVIANLIHKDLESCSIQFEIKDTGIGIPLEKQETIFDSFSQGSVEINRKYGGTGLGLTIVKRLVALMGGKIGVHSIVGQGATFHFDLDFKIGYKEVLVNHNHIEDEGIFVDKKILLVEDNKINQMITKKILEKKLIKCKICETGEDAIEVMKTNQFDLVLMDVHLPGINGTIATEEIRKFDNHTPIIALTAISLNENREMLLSFGMNDVITKPFNPDVFYKIIEQNLIHHTNINL